MARLGLRPGGLMPLMEHLTDLRRALVISGATVVVAAGGMMFFARQILRFILVPLYQLHITPIQIRPMEYIFAMLKVSTIGGVFLALPVIFWQLWSFARPALKPREARMAVWVLPVAVALFSCGVVFAYLVVYKVAIRFLLTMGAGVVTPYISLAEYINFTIMFLLPFGLMFEMPLVTMILTGLGILTPRFLAAKRKYAFFFTFVLAIVLIPDPSLFTQSLLALPMYILFEVSLLLSRLTQRRREKALAAAAAGGG